MPTTLSGAEFSDLAGCVDTETQVKQLFTAPLIGLASVVLDPALCVHTPEALWLSTGVRAIDHAVETILSSAPEPIADLGMSTRLRDVGVEPSHFDAIADGAMLNAFLRANIRPVSREDIIALLEKAY